MGPRSKSAKSKAAPASAAAEAVVREALPTTDTNPPHLFVLPSNLSKEARIVTLAHPRTLAPTRYYHCPSTGIYEIKHVSPPPSFKQSLLLAPNASSKDDSEPEEITEDGESQPAPDADSRLTQGYVLQTASLFTVTPFDPLFLLLPALSPKPLAASAKADYKPLFLSIDDHLDNSLEFSKHLRHILSYDATRRLLEVRLASVCDVVDAGDEKMYRLNHMSLLQELMNKAKRMAEGGLPKSMEERFVRKALEVPMATVLAEQERQAEHGKKKEGESFVDAEDAPSSITRTASSGSAMESQASTASSTSTALTVPSPGATSTPSLTATPETTDLLRLRVALSYLLHSYVPPHLCASLETLLATPSSQSSTLPDFTSLTTHLSALATLRADTAAKAKELMVGESHKRQFEDDDAAAERVEKKRRKEEEEKKKKREESRGIKDLRKVNTSGMKKMSDFFKKKS